MTLRLHPRPKVQAIALANGQRCFVIDDFLLNPEEMVDYAASRMRDMRPAGTAELASYPGIRMPFPPEIMARLTEHFNQHVRHHLDARRVISADWGMSLATLQPHELRPAQWICHRDFTPEGAQGFGMAACVLYLFKDAALGGTSLYQPKQDEAQTAQLVNDSLRMDGEAFAQRYGIARNYMTGSNPYFAQIGAIAPRWNRMVFYDGTIFHTSDIAEPARLSDDPRSGRLTLNGFIVCTRKAR